MQGKTDQFWTFGNIPAVEGFSCALFPVFLFEVGEIFYCVIEGLLIHLKLKTYIFYLKVLKKICNNSIDVLFNLSASFE